MTVAAAHASLGLLLIILAVLAFAGAVWRAFANGTSSVPCCSR